MIISYHRPEDIQQALEALSRKDLCVRPLGGGTVLSRIHAPDFAVVDLSRLGLDRIEREGKLLRVGATVTLQALYDDEANLDQGGEGSGSGLRAGILRESHANLRRAASVAGTIVSCDGRSPFVTALLALDARLVWISLEGNTTRTTEEPLGDYLPLREVCPTGRLMTHVQFPLNARLVIEIVSRTPGSQPIVCAAVAVWPSGRTRVVLGGHGKAPVLAMDGPEPGGAVLAAREAYRFAEDKWAGAAYRMDVAGRLVHRILSPT